jgi:hypothetical protein
MVRNGVTEKIEPPEFQTTVCDSVHNAVLT